MTARPSRSRALDGPTGRPDLTPPADLPRLPSFSVSDGRGPADTRPMRPEFTPTPHRRPGCGAACLLTRLSRGPVQLPSGYLPPAGMFTFSSLSFWSREMSVCVLWGCPAGTVAPPSLETRPGGSEQTTRVRSILCAVSLRPSLCLAVQAAPGLGAVCSPSSPSVPRAVPPWTALVASRLLTVRPSGPRLLGPTCPCCR